MYLLGGTQRKTKQEFLCKTFRNFFRGRVAVGIPVLPENASLS